MKRMQDGGDSSIAPSTNVFGGSRQPVLDEDHDEEECRVCRESNGILFRPCKCAGSIRSTHQECLLQWLQHSGKDSCELCKHKFHFQPVYADDAPTHIPARQVLGRCLRKAVCDYLPFVVRLVIVAVLWLGVVPCTTSWIYRIWIHRASLLVPDLIRRRLHGEGSGMLWNDAVSGIIIVGFIIFSFLSLMSFADFLRFHWEVRDVNGGGGAEEEMAQDEHNAQDGNDNDNHDLVGHEHAHRERGHPRAEARVPANANQNREREEPAEFPQQQGAQAPRGVIVNNLNNNENAGGAGIDADMDVELHVAVDELMGVRGPFVYLVRNILWLVAFNGAYLGLFAFIPYSVGAAVVGAAEKYVETPLGICTLRFLVPRSICKLAAEVCQAAAAEEHTLQLPDLGVILLGYLLMSAMVFTWRSIVCAVCKRMAVTALPMLGKVVRMLECTAAVVKVGVLLFSKMALCPLLLGLWLDAATTQVIGPDHAVRVRFATENLVGALLLHWVAGITFMLFVTVSVLQLREVLHPDILARIIRPQEPQPDLLGSLLQESGLTHARRMAISLGIYVLLLLLFVYLPAELLAFAGFNATGTGLFHINFFYLAPQLQIPFELIIFHLAMLAFLEHTKNAIGRLQYMWLRPFCKVLGLTRYLLPLTRLHPPEQPAGVPTRDMEFLVGPPVPRPPMDWEEEAGRDDARWAWGNEPMSEVERNVAPRARPSWCGVRLFVLLVASWAAILALVSTALLTPLVLGRLIFMLLRVPSRFYHDPLAFAAGLALCWVAHKCLVRLHQRIEVADVRAWVARTSCPTSFRAVVAVSAFAAMWFVIAPLLLGLLYDAAVALPPNCWAEEGFGSLQLWADWALGLALLHQWAYLAATGMVDGAWFPRIGRAAEQGVEEGRGFGFNQQAVVVTAEALQAVFRSWRWEDATLNKLLAPFVWPVTAQLLELVVVPANAAFALAYMRDRVPDLPYLAGLPSPEAMTSAELQLLCFRMTVVAWTLAMFSIKCVVPLHRWVSSIQAAVRDEKYLVRLELVNYA
ncbi:hypothetical protein NSK_003226 [Nannochloropsis salina CCMP1776]|uniref:RING-type E3 ubiquitin transferase n=1 Tax=Nannochloropsis salina CCMP1776 TaxID=1027361 RepID=A0A4D9D1W8_9STRA|nr:hypothetical protein NSK_003226 [Nannochloropsis salina CCMP1776]|eukprot:TFJ85721.1 hypothetical protein NSK_003226 [Nannochloropsis salina CCMP1776]